MSKKKIIIILSSVLGLIAVLAAAFFIYVGIYYHADTDAIAAYSYDGYDLREMDEGTLAFVPKGDFDTGIVFYPGGKVEYEAYVPLMQCLASKGVLCILVEMPFNLAVFDFDRATDTYEGFFMVEHWYMAGHSLGGAMACKYVDTKQHLFDGVILLASYSTVDLSNSALRFLSIYGSNDGVLDMDAYADNKKNLPNDVVEYVIDGGNHAYFGVYGEQKKDGEATVTNKEQIEITAEQIVNFLSK